MRGRAVLRRTALYPSEARLAASCFPDHIGTAEVLYMPLERSRRALGRPRAMRESARA